MINNYIKATEDSLIKYFENKEFENHPLILEAMKYTTLLPSKKLRAILCLEASRIFSANWERALPLACAIEMLHSQSLIHDDLPCMDNDTLRRGKPTNHIVYGEDIAVLAGDALISYGAQIILEANLDKSILLNYLKTAGAFGIVGGQVADMKSEEKKISLEELEFIHKYKTASMFELALTGGATIGGANEEQKKMIADFAKHYGLAFQIKDDILDVVSTTEELGKTTGKDENSQKATYVTILGLEGAKEKLGEEIKYCYDIIKGVNSKVFEEILKKLEN